LMCWRVVVVWWVAVRHGDDHIHIVAMLARPGRAAAGGEQRPVPGEGGAGWPVGGASGHEPVRTLYRDLPPEMAEVMQYSDLLYSDLRPP
jgi:hypothetical protein